MAVTAGRIRIGRGRVGTLRQAWDRMGGSGACGMVEILLIRKSGDHADGMRCDDSPVAGVRAGAERAHTDIIHHVGGETRHLNGRGGHLPHGSPSRVGFRFILEFPSVF